MNAILRDLARQCARQEIAEVQRDAGKLAEKHGPEFVRARLNELERRLAFYQEEFVGTIVACPSCGQQNRVFGGKGSACGKCNTRLTPTEPVPVPVRRRSRKEGDAMVRQINDALGGWRFEEDK